VHGGENESRSPGSYFIDFLVIPIICHYAVCIFLRDFAVFIKGGIAGTALVDV
jgi:hypothetical protein